MIETQTQHFAAPWKPGLRWACWEEQGLLLNAATTSWVRDISRYFYLTITEGSGLAYAGHSSKHFTDRNSFHPVQCSFTLPLSSLHAHPSKLKPLSVSCLKSFSRSWLTFVFLSELSCALDGNPLFSPDCNFSGLKSGDDLKGMVFLYSPKARVALKV